MTYKRFVSELRGKGYIPLKYSKSDTNTILNLTFDELRFDNFDNLNKIETVLIAEDLYDVEITNEEMKSFISLSDIIQCVSLKLSNDDVRQNFESLFEGQEFYVYSEKEVMWKGYKLALNDNKWKPMSTAPMDGKCILWVQFDNECKQMMLERDSRGEWLYEGEPLYSHRFHIKPLLWTECPSDPETL